MAKTSTFSVTTAATAVTTSIATPSVIVGEDASVVNWPTTDFKIQAPANTDTAIQRPSGTTWEFTCPGAYWPAGTIVGYVKTATGTTTFLQFEKGL